MTSADLRQWRLDRGLTQAAIGDLLGLPTGQGTCRQWQRWESGERRWPAMLELALEALDARIARVRRRKRA